MGKDSQVCVRTGECLMKTLRERTVRPVTPRMLIAALAIIAVSVPAMAALGGDVTSVQADREHMKATLNIKQNETYTVHEIKAPGGTLVSEYVSSQGRVFAVAWRGPFLPEMEQILGAYFQQFSTAVQAQKRVYGHHMLNIQQPGLVVQSGGHMRAYFGRAYVPEMLPSTVKVEDIK